MQSRKIIVSVFILVYCLAWSEVKVTNVTVKPRWPWNGLVDITYCIECDEMDDDGKPKDVYVTFTGFDNVRNQKIAMRTLSGDGAKDAVKHGGPYTVTWDADKDCPKLNSTAFHLEVHARVGFPCYLVIYLDKLNDAKAKKYDYKNQPPDLSNDACRTTELWLRQIQPSTFTMGAVSGRSDERPLHDVTLTKMYYIGIFECTQKQWKLVMGENSAPSYFQGDNRPVEQVYYNIIRGTSSSGGAGWPGKGHAVDGNSFMGILRAKTGLLFDLPTEAQWEYAARGGNESQGYSYSGSNNVDIVAWHSGNSNNQTHVVGTKQPNELGIYDMSGNVWEWCLDWYGSNYYASSPKEEPPGPASSSSVRVLRGGRWRHEISDCRTAARHYSLSSSIYHDYGFRVIFLPEE